MSATNFQKDKFDWSSMIYDVFNKEKQEGVPAPSRVSGMMSTTMSSNNTSTSTSPLFSPVLYPKKESMSPLATVDEEVWLDDLLSDDQMLLNENGVRKEASTVNNGPIAANNAGNLDYASSFGSSNSLFSTQFQQSQQQDFIDSAATSFANTPLIKSEEAGIPVVPGFELDAGSRNSSIDSMFKDIFSDIDENDAENAGTCAESVDADSTALKTAKPKKKRAPRKRLTDHQKQAHNKIEKKYRININLKIAGLQKIIPWLSGEKTAFEIGDELNDRDIKSQAASELLPRMNKSMILDKLTLYILHLQESDRLLRRENEELKLKLLAIGN